MSVARSAVEIDAWAPPMPCHDDSVMHKQQLDSGLDRVSVVGLGRRKQLTVYFSEGQALENTANMAVSLSQYTPVH